MSKTGKDALFNGSTFRADFKNVIAKRSDLVQFASGRLVAPGSGDAVLQAGQVLGQVTATKRWKAYDNAASDGSEVAKGVLASRADYDSDDNGSSIVIIMKGSLLQDLLVGLDSPAIVDLKGTSYSESGVNIIDIG